MLVRLRRDEIGVRCLRCAASAVHLAIGHVLVERLPDLSSTDACELSTRGALAEFLQRRAHSVALSEFVDGAIPGAMADGVRCEDVQALSYPDQHFDLITHTEVLEHVPDDLRAFTELYRVLRPGGIMFFSVPMRSGEATLERARMVDGTVEHLCEPSHHIDPFRSGAQILAYRDYGGDIVERLRAVGFVDVGLSAPCAHIPWVTPREIIRARRPSEAP
ncbi:MAG: class I SAM-dependent methyltransferase [Dokdonella sp.]